MTRRDEPVAAPAEPSFATKQQQQQQQHENFCIIRNDDAARRPATDTRERFTHVHASTVLAANKEEASALHNSLAPVASVLAKLVELLRLRDYWHFLAVFAAFPKISTSHSKSVMEKTKDSLVLETGQLVYY